MNNLAELVARSINRAYANGYDLLDSFSDEDIAQDMLMYDETFEGESLMLMIQAIAHVRENNKK